MLARIRASSDTNVRLLFSGVAEAGSIFMTSRNAFFDVRDEGYVSSVTMGGSSDGAYTDPNNGGFITPVPAPTPEEPNPEPILMTTTRRYQAVWSGTYNSNGQLRPYLDIYQGKDANTPNDGNRRSLIGFPTQIKTDLAGAQIHSMKLFLHSSSAAMASNSQVRIGAHGAINRPNNYISEGTVVRVERMGKWYWNRGQTRWIPLPKDSWDIFKFDDGYKGIFIGPWYSDSTNQFIGFHGAGKGSKSPVLEIIYTK